MLLVPGPASASIAFAMFALGASAACAGPPPGGFQSWVSVFRITVPLTVQLGTSPVAETTGRVRRMRRTPARRVPILGFGISDHRAADGTTRDLAGGRNDWARSPHAPDPHPPGSNPGFRYFGSPYGTTRDLAGGRNDWARSPHAPAPRPAGSNPGF